MVAPAADALRLPAQPMISMKYCQMLSQSKLLYLGRIVGIRMGPQPKSLGAARFAFQASSLIPSFMSVHKRTVSYLSASYLKIMSGAPFVFVHVRPLAQSYRLTHNNGECLRESTNVHKEYSSSR